MRSSEMDSLPIKGRLFVPSKGKSAVFFIEDEVILETDFGILADLPQPTQVEAASTGCK